MRNIQLKAEKKFGKYQAGQEFLANKVEAKALVALGRAFYVASTEDKAMRVALEIVGIADGEERKFEPSACMGDVQKSNPDGLDALDLDALHALAKELEVEVHHRAGADKVRAAIRASFN